MKLVTILDLETTGKFHPDHRIIELSMRLCDLETHKELKSVLMRFDPERNIDAKAYAVHGIGLDELKGKPKIKESLPLIKEILEKSCLGVAHNGDDFDFPYLQMEFERNGVEFPKITTFDTMIHGNFATDLGKSPSLKELAWCLDVEYNPDDAHKGDYDTAVLRDCFFNGIERGWFNLEIQ